MNPNDSGLEGTDYQIKLLALIALEGLFHDEDWKLSTEHKLAGKFDDIVYQSGEIHYLIQCKHKKNKNVIRWRDLTVTNKKNEFYLPKYFDSFLKVKDYLNVAYFVLCCNISPDETEHFLKEMRITVPLFPGDISSYILEESRIGEVMKLLDVSDERLVSEFREKLRLFHINDSQIDDSISVKLTEAAGAMQLEFEVNHFLGRVKNWFLSKNKKEIEKSHVSAFLYEYRSQKYMAKLKLLEIYFKKSYDIGNEQVLNIISTNENFLHILKLSRSLFTLINEDQIIFMNPEDEVKATDVCIKSFQLPRLSILIIFLYSIDEKSKIYDQIKTILKKYAYKKVIISSKKSIHSHFTDTSYAEITDEIYFDDLTETSQKYLLSKSVNFQGTKISIHELISGNCQSIDELMVKCPNLSCIIDQRTIIDLIKDRDIDIGTSIENLGDIPEYYFARKIVNHKNDEFQENTIRDLVITSKKCFLLSNEAGMGKTTYLTNLGYAIKKKYPYLFLIRINLNQFTGILRKFLKAGKVSIELEEILGSKKKNIFINAFERHIFLMKKRVVLFVDGVDEIGPTYITLIENFLLDSSKRENISKIFVTTRPHLELDLESLLNTKSYQLLPYGYMDQIDFLKAYWIKNLSIENYEEQNKCGIYAETLILTIINSIGNNSRSCIGIPLQTRMIGDIFQGSDEWKHNWVCCKDFLKSADGNLKFPSKFNIAKLYDMFVEQECDIFINDKCLAEGNTAIEQLFDGDDVLIEHQKKAAELLLSESDYSLMRISKHDKTVSKQIILKIGLLEEIGDELLFIHRSYAEYFVAKALWAQLKRNDSQKFMKFTLGTVFVNEQYEGIRTFFESILIDEFGVITDAVFDVCGTIVDSITWGEKTNITFLAKEGRLNILKLMLRKCGNIKQLLSIDKNHLILIEGIEYRDIIELLVEKGADIEQQDAHGRTVLHYAAIRRKVKIAKFCLEHGANVNQIDIYGYSVVLYAASQDLVELVKLCIEKGADLNQVDNDGRNIIYHISGKKDLSLEKYCVDRGADTNRNDIKGITVLHHAASLGKLELMKFCVERGADINQRDDDGNTVVIHAVTSGIVGIVEFCLENGADINQRNKDGRSALLYAAEYSKSEIVRLGLQNSGYINQSDGKGRTIMHYAALYGHLELLEFCVENGADFDHKDNNGKKVIHFAASSSSSELIQFCLEKGADINQSDNKGTSVLLYAAKTGNLELITFCVSKGADINHSDNEGNTILLDAAKSGNIEMMKFCLERGADINQSDNQGKTPILYVTESSRKELVEFCMRQGADINLSDNFGTTVILDAARSGNLELVKFCVENGADINQTDSIGRSLIHCGASSGNVELIEFCLQLGMNINQSDNNEKTVILHAAESGRIDLVKFCVEKGADMNGKDNAGNSVLLYAAEHGHSELMKFCSERGANMSQSNNDGRNIMHSAALSGKLESIKYLMTFKADLNKTDSNGRTVLHYAALSGQLNMMEFCVESGADINKRDDDGRTILHYVTTMGQSRLIKYLVGRGANINQSDNDGRTVIHYTALLEQSKLLWYFEKMGVNIYRGNYVEKNKLQLMKYFVDMGADINHSDKTKRTAIHYAALYGQLGFLKFCVEIGADINRFDINGCSVIHYAAIFGQLNLIKFCLERGANINQSDTNGCPVILYAAKSGRLEVVKFCLEQKTKMNPTIMAILQSYAYLADVLADYYL